MMMIATAPSAPQFIASAGCAGNAIYVPTSNVSPTNSSSFRTTTPPATTILSPHHQLPVLQHFKLAQLQQPNLPSPPAVEAAAFSATQKVVPDKQELVNGLVDTAVSIAEAVCQQQRPEFPQTDTAAKCKVFIQEILKRSRTSFSTLQLSLLYLVRLRNKMNKQSDEGINGGHTVEGGVNECDNFSAVQPSCPSPSPIPMCSRRIFLSALILASKYLQDKSYSNRAWAKLSGLAMSEISMFEWKFLDLIDHELFVSRSTFVLWSKLLLTRSSSKRDGNVAASKKNDDLTATDCLDSFAATAGTKAFDHTFINVANATSPDNKNIILKSITKNPSSNPFSITSLLNPVSTVAALATTTTTPSLIQCLTPVSLAYSPVTPASDPSLEFAAISTNNKRRWQDIVLNAEDKCDEEENGKKMFKIARM